MRELKHINTIRPWPHNNMVRPQDDRTPRRSKFVVGGFIALLAALFVMSLFRAPQIAWMVGLAAAVTMLAVAIALGLRQWARDRIK